MNLMRWLSLLPLLLTVPAKAASSSSSSSLQNVVTYDEYSLMINGTRLFVFSGEFHPFRYSLAIEFGYTGLKMYRLLT